MAEERDQVISVMRACVLSLKGEITLYNLANDYLTMNGSKIPYQRLGYATLEAFVNSTSDMRVSPSAKGVLVVTCTPTTNTDHIVRMIAAQKDSKKSKNVPASSGIITRTVWHKPSNNESKPSNSCVKPENSRYLGRNYDPNYRAKFTGAAASSGTGHPPWKKGPGNSDQTDRGKPLPRPSGDKEGRYRGPCPVAPRFQAIRRARTPSPESDNWDEDTPVEAQAATSGGDQGEIGSDGEKDASPLPEQDSQERDTEVVLPEQSKEEEPLRVLEDKPEQPAMMGLTPMQLRLQAYQQHLLPKKSVAQQDSDETPLLDDSLSMELVHPLPERIDAVQPNEHLLGVKLVTLRDYVNTVNMGVPLVNVDLHASGSGYVCTIIVWLFAFESGDEVGQTRSWSVEMTAATALAALQRMSLPIELNYEQPAFVVNRLLSIVYQHTAGIWKHCVPDLYTSLYAEPLPPHWVEMFLEKTLGVAISVITNPSLNEDIWKPLLVVAIRLPGHTSNAAYPAEILIRPHIMRLITNEPRMNQSHIRLVRPIFRPLEWSGPTSVRPPQPLLSTRYNPRARFNPRLEAPPPPSPPPIAISAQSPMQSPSVSSEGNSLTPVAFNSDFVDADVDAAVDAWQVVVVNVLATDQVWIRREGQEFNAIYNRMVNEMNRYYASTDKGQVLPVVGKLYAIYVEHCWHRVKLMNMEASGLATLLFIDQGEEEQHNFQMCQYLDDAFTKLPPQAVRCILAGMEELSNLPKHLPLLLKSLFGKSFVAFIDVEAVDGVEKIYVTLHSIDARGDLNMNYLLSEQMCRAAAPPTLPAAGEAVEVYVSHITADGKVFVHAICEAYKFLKVLLYQLGQRHLDMDKYRVVNTVTNARRYLLQFPESTNVYLRVVALCAPDSTGRVIVAYIDYGNVEYTDVKFLYDLGSLSDAVWSLPPLAKQVVLHKLPPVTPKMAELLRGLAPRTQRVLMKVVKAGLANEVELFMRIQPNNILVSINNALENDPRIVEEPTLYEQTMVKEQQEMVSAFAAVPRHKPVATVIPDMASELSKIIAVMGNASMESKVATVNPVRGAEVKEMTDRTSADPGPMPAVSELSNMIAHLRENPKRPEEKTALSKSVEDLAIVGTDTPPQSRRRAAQQGALKPVPPPLSVIPEACRRQIPPPVIPPLGVEFDVHIPLVSNPTNFFVQPWQDNASLELMMLNIQKFYNRLDNQEPVNKEFVRPNFVFALLNSDGFWYRVVVRDLASEEQALVWLCDFGDLILVQYSALRVLNEAFLYLPRQAIKARIHGIRPTHQDWSVDDCIRFQKLITAKAFVSYIHLKTPDSDYRNEEILSLDLIDTSSSGFDLHIDKLLVSENRAVFTQNDSIV